VDANDLKSKLLDEVLRALGLGKSRLARVLLRPLFTPAAMRFAELAVTFDDDVAHYGFREAARRALPIFTREVHARGMEHIPASGPLLIVSNHPGTVDGLVIASNMPRPDLKIVASGVPFVRSLNATADHLIYSSLDMHERMAIIRHAIDHLDAGGALLIFPSGGIDPDPAVMSGAEQELETWSRSLDVILRRAPNAQILVTSVSGVLHSHWVRSPLTKLCNGRRNQQRVAEFLQVIQQMIMPMPRSMLVSPSVRFADPFAIQPGDRAMLLTSIITRAKQNLAALGS
jgi:hypothetical protein